ncbi:MAG TPA: polysaccharide lyase family 1 protein [Sandaracinaceae bacterium LLY-WYZ-13_1]|nr:polysaccharide lyase family 1 protein [Sandaracinaceae bacterium LLY-WYZ-13_1]
MRSPDAGAADPCAAFVGPEVEVCATFPTACELVFRDGRGCDAACAVAGLVCAASYEDVSGACAPDRARPALGCGDTGHGSDYCVCVDPAGCTPSCDGRECGSDGCGGTCGGCADDEACRAGACESAIRPHEVLVSEVVGFGRHTTGGLGGPVCWVDSLDDAGSGTLRDCAEGGGPRWIRFRVSGEIRLRSPLDVASDKTIDGRGQRIEITGRGVRLDGVRNVILHNLIFRDGAGDDGEDAIRIVDGTENVWIDHVTLSDYPDGLIDITRASRMVTVSWCELFDHDKVMLISHSPEHTPDEAIRVTLHHNHFHDTTQRHPRLRFGRVHTFNNLHRRWDSYAIGASHRSQLVSEHNVFVAGSDPDAIETRVGSDPDHAECVRSDGDRFRNGARRRERDPDECFVPDYPYTLDPVGDVESIVRAGAGWQDVVAP